MTFGTQENSDWDILLPSFLLEIDKERLKRQLGQFFGDHRQGEVKYDGFYHDSPPNYFMQGDIIKSSRCLIWDGENSDYGFIERPVTLLSNTCDVSEENDRGMPKNALIAPTIKLSEYVDALTNSGFSKDKIISIVSAIKNQQYSNLFYLPPNPITKNDYVVPFDHLFWQPPSVLNNKLPNIVDERFISLHHFGFYLLISKLSYHFCRAQEAPDR